MIGFRAWVVTYLANSTMASVAAGERSFLTRNMLRGGDGHVRDRRSLLGVSASVSKGRVVVRANC